MPPGFQCSVQICFPCSFADSFDLFHWIYTSETYVICTVYTLICTINVSITHTVCILLWFSLIGFLLSSPLQKLLYETNRKQATRMKRYYVVSSYHYWEMFAIMADTLLRQVLSTTHRKHYTWWKCQANLGGVSLQWETAPLCLQPPLKKAKTALGFSSPSTAV